MEQQFSLTIHGDLDNYFGYLCQKSSVFRFWCSLRFVDFRGLFSIWFSVFVKDTNGFLDEVFDKVLGFSYLGSGFSLI